MCPLPHAISGGAALGAFVLAAGEPDAWTVDTLEVLISGARSKLTQSCSPTWARARDCTGSRLAPRTRRDAGGMGPVLALSSEGPAAQAPALSGGRLTGVQAPRVAGPGGGSTMERITALVIAISLASVGLASTASAQTGPQLNVVCNEPLYEHCERAQQLVDDLEDTEPCEGDQVGVQNPVFALCVDEPDPDEPAVHIHRCDGGYYLEFHPTGGQSRCFYINR